MGWDAYATKNDRPLELERLGPAHHRLADPVLREAFAQAARRPGACDGNLPRGGLDCSGCADVLEQLSGLSAYSEVGWDADWVSMLAERTTEADWALCDEGFRDSTRAFLECCAAHNLGIGFSF